MRPRLVFLRDLFADLGQAARGRASGRARRPAGRPAVTGRSVRRAQPDEARSAEEMTRRLDETRERLKREIPPEEEPRAGDRPH